MLKELKGSYKGRDIEIHLLGYGASEHVQVMVNSNDVSSHLQMPDTEPEKGDLSLAMAQVHNLIDSELL
ncbi:hypothetical protein [Deinococcus sp. UYEF24]